MTDSSPPDTPASAAPIDPRQRNRNRLALIGLFLLFIGPIGVAWVLNAGQLIPGAKTYGERIDPLLDLRQSPPRRADGSVYDWAPTERKRRLLVAAPADCAAPCVTLAKDLDKLRQIFGKEAEHLDLLWMGPLPAGAPAGYIALADDPALRAKLPRSAAVVGKESAGAPVYVIDPYGFVILRYAPGSDIAEMRKDLNKLLKMR